MERKLSTLKEFEDYKGYTVDDNGIVRSYLIQGRKPKGCKDYIDWGKEPVIIRTPNNSNGYKHCRLYSKYNKPKDLLIHRAVALLFIDSSNDLPCVNHKDGNKNNNNVRNLEWVTHKENTAHAFEVGLTDRFKNGMNRPVVKYDLQGNFIEEFECVSDAVISLGFKNSSKSAITRCCKGKQKTSGGFFWKFKNVEGSTTSRETYTVS